MKHFFAYIRVSTAKQGVHGVSLQEQHDAIVRFAEREKLTISSWFEERETAAKRGRPVFSKMLAQLKRGFADGVIIHKIDRSARNLKDWADLGEAIDRGIEVRFANETIDMNSRGGRLSADIQAVVAADFIRNLREEIRKGFYGRLKQGIYPLPAPLGYLNGGRGNLKTLDPATAPLVRQAFEIYASGRHSLRGLCEEMWRRGLRAHRAGGKMGHRAMTIMLKNSFYTGVIRVKKTGETFAGGHLPLIAKSTFDRVQQVMAGKAYTLPPQRDFPYRRLFRCRQCQQTIIGEQHRKRVYYRCHTRGCTIVYEENIEAAVMECLRPLVFSEKEKKYLAVAVERIGTDWKNREAEQRAALALRTAKLNERLDRLTDAFVDGTIDKASFERLKAGIIWEQKEVEESVRGMVRAESKIAAQVAKYLELAQAAYLLHKTAIPAEMREMLKILTSNREAYPKNVAMTLSEPFLTIANRRNGYTENPSCNIPRTLDRLLASLVEYVSQVETRIIN